MLSNNDAKQCKTSFTVDINRAVLFMTENLACRISGPQKNLLNAAPELKCFKC